MKRILSVLVCSLLCLNAFGQFTATLSGNPVDITGWIMGPQSSIQGSSIRLTQAIGNQAGYIYYATPENLTSCAQFTVDFDFKIQAALFQTVADGIAFWYITTPPSTFNLGEYIGMPAFSTGLALILDTYNNNSPVDVPLATVVTLNASNYVEDGTVGVLGTPIVNQSFIDDGQWHHCTMSYDNGNIAVFFNNSTTPSITAFYALNLTGYFGFSASTGGSVSTQSIQNVNIVGIETPAPPVVVSPVNYCQFATADTLTTTTGANVRWYTTDTGTIPLPGSPTPNTSVPGSTWYYVSQLPGYCISPKDSIEVIVTAQSPPPVISGDTAYCQNDVFTPFVVAGTNILWYTADTGGVGTSTAPVVNTAVPGTYVYYASQNSTGCEGLRDSIVVTVYPTPVAPTITGTTTYCQGATFIPFTVVGQNILWYGSATGGTGSAATPSVATDVPGTYVYYASQTINTCEGPRASITVTVYATPPPPVITGATQYCIGSPFTPISATGTGILWYTTTLGDPGSTTPPVVNTTTPGADTFYASQTINGCEGPRAYIIVNVNNGVSPSFTYSIHPGCINDTVLFTNTSTGGTFYRWTYTDGTSDTSVTSNPVHIFPPGTYIVMLQATNFHCIDSVKQTITLSHPDTARFTIAPDTIVCQGTPILFTNTTIPSTAFAVWNFGDGVIDSANFSPSHTYNTAGVYTVKMVENNSVPCFDSFFQKIYVDSNSGPVVTISDSVICEGNAVTMTGDFSYIGIASYKWDFGDGSSVYNQNPTTHAYGTAGNMQVTLTTAYRVCPGASVTKNILVSATPLIDLGRDTSMCPTDPPFIISDYLNAGNVGAKWVWSTGDTTSSLIINQPGLYYSRVSIDGCTATDSVWVKNDCYINIPNVFSPNNDGENDYFFPRALLTSGLATFRMMIYNRWGEEIFETGNTDGRGWDGKFNGKDQPVGVYIYNIDATMKNGRVEHHQGNVSLIR